MLNTNRGKLTVLVGGQYGSEGKGAVAAHIANEYQMHIRVGSPNAGHTIYWAGEKHVMQSIPCGWINPCAKIVIGRGALLNMKQFMKELVHIMRYYPDFLDRLYIDGKAGILSEKFHQEEGGIHGEMHKRIGSTGEGVGPARIARLKRDLNEFQLFESVAEEYGLEKCVTYNTPRMIAQAQDNGCNILVEGTQGSALSLLHSFFPYCTSIDTNTAGIISEVGIAPSRVTNVLMVVRTYPIRVAGTSGPMANETTWEAISEKLGREVTEKTTVTKKTRRVAEWDDALFENACVLNAPTELALTFADYIDPEIFECDDYDKVINSKALNDFMVKHNIHGKVKYIGTGPATMVEVL